MVYIIGGGSERDRASLPLATRRGTHIPNEQRQEAVPQQQQAAIDVWRCKRPQARMRSITAVYNCMGMVFAARRTWIDTDDISMILDEDGYRRLPSADSVQEGDLVLYKRPSIQDYTHVGIIINIVPDFQKGSREITVLSKWGADGEYLHLIDHVPDLFGLPSEYWTDRRAIP